MLNLSACVRPEIPREVADTSGLGKVSDQEVVRRLRALRKKQS